MLVIVLPCFDFNIGRCSLFLYVAHILNTFDKDKNDNRLSLVSFNTHIAAFSVLVEISHQTVR